MTKNHLLEMVGISKYFPGVQALDEVKLTVKAGTIHALMGENGAGKSTLMKCLFGTYKKDSGEIFIEGESVDFGNAKEALENGVAMVQQELNQALTRTVKDNLWLGRYPLKGPFVDERKMAKETDEIFNNLNISIDANAIMSTLPVSQRQMVEIAKAVSYNSKIIVLDEPTSSLSENEVEHLFRILRDLRERGVGIIYISHKMDEIREISDEITIMRDGQWIATEATQDISIDEIIRLMVGRELTHRFPDKTNVVKDDVMMSVKNISGRYTNLHDASFDLHAGEILGVAGLDGAGRTELLENIFGEMTRKGGQIFLEGQEVQNKNPKDSIKNGFALLTEERRATGILGIRDILDNTVISSLKRYLNFNLFLDDKKMLEATEWAIDSLDVRTPSHKTQIRALSGGNQQKVIIGRWLLTQPKVLLLDEPTRGIDVGAKYQIYELIIELASEGKGVVVVSSEMPELLGICDRILVMSNGRVAGELDPKTTNQEEILKLAEKYL